MVVTLYSYITFKITVQKYFTTTQSFCVIDEGNKI